MQLTRYIQVKSDASSNNGQQGVEIIEPKDHQIAGDSLRVAEGLL